ncbi:hypothetical protein B0T26DRAFT_745057 [Lasiosphaeria miniovina]|uniref:Uncharacterized protein n=1 Tax=Lasiosphaeria miniovina TaxID=1954250 RepID=A0AA40BEY4_9PEZI|nr:uncharacterized protein B0T26DRAFT_745057 [Lasiosphaeria miniovina]KAK0732956.1 hypothetical protein B0T26DRAFT_745057 [Lasiosphaeria miniovina]
MLDDLRNLLATIDLLNRTYGIIHNHFNAGSVGRRRDHEFDPFDRDTTCAAICAYQIITHDLETHADGNMVASVRVEHVLDLDSRNHRGVTLDSCKDVDDYKSVLRTKRPRQIKWDLFKEDDELVRTRCALASRGKIYIDWQRPSSSAARPLAPGSACLPPARSCFLMAGGAW